MSYFLAQFSLLSFLLACNLVISKVPLGDSEPEGHSRTKEQASHQNFNLQHALSRGLRYNLEQTRVETKARHLLYRHRPFSTPRFVFHHSV